MNIELITSVINDLYEKEINVKPKLISNMRVLEHKDATRYKVRLIDKLNNIDKFIFVDSDNDEPIIDTFIKLTNEIIKEVKK